jgi:hypothetical protein
MRIFTGRFEINGGKSMTIEKIRTQMTSAIWQAVAQSGVNLSSIPQEEQEKLVRV